jgi:hypothetical protein
MTTQEFAELCTAENSRHLSLVNLLASHHGEFAAFQAAVNYGAMNRVE